MKTTSLAISSLLVAACAASEPDPDLLLDQDAIESGADDGKADGIELTRLERVTVAELADYTIDVRGTEIVDCFAGYREEIDASATHVTKAIADKFYAVRAPACHDWSLLARIAKGVLDLRGFSRALPTTIVSSIGAWARPQLETAAVGGYVSPEKVSLQFYGDLVVLQDRNAIAREQDPPGVDLGAIRTAWDRVRANTTLDRAYLNPVTFGPGALEGSRLFSSLRAAFPLRGLALEATGYDAIAEFAGAYEGPDHDPAFAPIRTALRKGSIKKRFYFSGGGEGWSRNVLIVIDQHGQAWGMLMGYSE